jgi:hypothetical protein
MFQTLHPAYATLKAGNPCRFTHSSLHAGRWLKQKRVSGSWRLSFIYLRYCGPSQAKCLVCHFIKRLGIRVFPDSFVGKHLTVGGGARPDLGPASVHRLARGVLWRPCAKPNCRAPPCAQDAPGRAARPAVFERGHRLAAAQTLTVNVQSLTACATMRC